jgi:hypothetical protein
MVTPAIRKTDISKSATGQYAGIQSVSVATHTMITSKSAKDAFRIEIPLMDPDY